VISVAESVCTVHSENVLRTLLAWRTKISLYFTWFFQGSNALFFFYILYILYRFGHIHLGVRQPKSRCRRQSWFAFSSPSQEKIGSTDNQDEQEEDFTEPPEFSTLWYICMIFTGGIGAGFFVYSVSQALSSQTGHFFAQAGYRSQDEIDLFALTVTMNMWGFSGWTPYLLVALNMCLAVHCFSLPMTLRSCLYPILGHHTWGWMGDLIDTIAIVSTIAGVTTSLGLGSVSIVFGFIHLGWVDPNAADGQITAIQNATIWVITVVSAATVLSPYGGVRILSGLAVGTSFSILLWVLLMEDTKFLLNLMVQEVGQYLSTNILLLNFWTDAFGQLREGSGRAIDGKAAAEGWME
jgi:choline-glycine betaine transporter